MTKKQGTREYGETAPLILVSRLIDAALIYGAIEHELMARTGNRRLVRQIIATIEKHHRQTLRRYGLTKPTSAESVRWQTATERLVARIDKHSRQRR